MKKLFITGTDTDVGKTYISIGILTACNKMGLSTLGLKPIASGGNADTLALQQVASLKLPKQQLNAFQFEKPIAPSIAALQLNNEITLQALNASMQMALTATADICVIEGFGGWYAPLNLTHTMADFAIAQQLNVLLVVGMRLGCLNHALLTFRAMQQDRVNVIGWIANCIEPNMLYLHENIENLKKLLPIPCLGVTPYHSQIENEIDLKKIISSL